MRALRIVTLAVALAIGLGEIARWWGDARMLPLALDELIVAAAMIWAARASTNLGAAPLAAAWGVYCGLMLALLVPTLDHLLFGPEKASAPFYAVILGAMLAVGLWALGRSLRLVREPPR